MALLEMHCTATGDFVTKYYLNTLEGKTPETSASEQYPQNPPLQNTGLHHSIKFDDKTP
jgi:hypothetical protein